MDNLTINDAIIRLKSQYHMLNFQYHDCTINGKIEKIYYWPGLDNEDVLVCSHQCNGVKETFHHHDFFFFNYTWEGEYNSLSQTYNHFVTIRKNELYAGQPWAGHALLAPDDQQTTIIGVLIKKETFFNLFLPLLSSYPKIFHFFANPVTYKFSEEYLHFKIEDHTAIRSTLEKMILEYASPRENSQPLLLSLALTLVLQIAKQLSVSEAYTTNLPKQCLYYIQAHLNNVSLKILSTEFSYTPGYISSILYKTYGKSFSNILVEQRMKRALTLLTSTNLTVEQIASFVGYSDKSNFHKTFKKFYGQSPRNYLSSPPINSSSHKSEKHI